MICSRSMQAIFWIGASEAVTARVSLVQESSGADASVKGLKMLRVLLHVQSFGDLEVLISEFFETDLFLGLPTRR